MRMAMMQVSRGSTLGAVVFTICALSIGWSQNTIPPVSVVATEVVSGSNVTYKYTVTNNTGSAIIRLSVGYDPVRKSPGLITPPVGWTRSGGLSASSVASPPGWTAVLLSQEENP